MTAGRPSEYNPAFVEALETYLDTYKELDEVIPTREGFAISIGVSKPTVNRWGSEHPELFAALELLDARQARELQNQGLLGTYNPTITKLMLSANHGMREKTDITTNDKDMPAVAGFTFIRNDDDTADNSAHS